ncbi:MAG: Crp/Fnr family transcriptional regulator [Gorillibacterium sp.]|nr:Crp/Fnr family transcriptional regulator [Gorillibacterium sp.]
MSDIVNKQTDMLRLVPLFRDLTHEELERIQSIAIPRSYRKKAVIFTEGTDKESIFFIQKGLVKAFKTDENGNEQIISFLKAGDMFPHTGFFNQDPYPATAEVTIDSRILAIPIRSFELLIMEMPVIAIKVMRVMSDKIKELQEMLQNITGQDVYDRAVSFLLKLAESYGIIKDNQVRIDLPMTNQEFASAIGTTRETINRIITLLRKEELLETVRSGFIISNYEALKSWSHKQG